MSQDLSPEDVEPKRSLVGDSSHIAGPDSPAGTSVDGFAGRNEIEIGEEETLFVEAGVVEQLLGLATGAEDGRAVPSDHALDLLLAPAVGLAGKAVTDHGRTCRSPATCQEVPQTLRQFLKMRPAVVEAKRAVLVQALLKYPNHKMTNWVREAWFETDAANGDHASLIEAIESKAIFTSDGLRKVLGDEPQKNAQRLGTTLWARRLRSPEERAFFELLRLIAHEPPPLAEPHPADPGAAPMRAARPRDRRDQHNKIAALDSEVRDLKRDRRKQSDALRRSEDQRTQLREELGSAQTELQCSRKEAEDLARDIRTARAELLVANRELQRVAESASALRRTSESARKEREDIEQSRSHVVGELSLRRREIEVLRAQLRATPTGKESVHAFLQEEERRIDTDLTILQGGALQRAQEEHALREKLEDAFKAAYPEFVPPRPVLRTEPASLRLTPLGGADEVGRSAYFLAIDDYSILIDCGIRINGRNFDEIAPAIDRIEQLDAVILTHAHTDHLGWLPALVHRFPEVYIYCTPQTAELVPIMLDDCKRHHFAMMHRLRENSAYSSTPVEIVDPYDPEDVLVVQDRLLGLNFGETENLPFSDLRLTFFRSGHILGAASALIEGAGRRVLMSGDISTEAQFTVDAVDWSGCGEVDLLVLESTYGDVIRRPLADQQRALVQFVAQTVTAGGSVILPCFGLGRGQEVAALLARAMADGELPRVSVWIDGMIRRINRVYERHCGNFAPADAGFIEVEAVHDRLSVVEEARRQPTIIVTTSGMLAGGPAVEYARALLGEPRNRIVFTGYQDEGNPGSALMKLTHAGSGSRRIQVLNEDGDPIDIVAAAPAEQFQLSAHADQTGLAMSAALVQPRHIILVHGDRAKQERLHERLRTEVPRAAVEYGALRTFQIP